MKLYLIAIVVAFIGLWISSEVQADDLCGLRVGTVFDVKSWTAQGTKGAVDFAAVLQSRDDKAIKGVGGQVEFFLGGDKHLAAFQIYLKQPVAAHGMITVQSSERRTAEAEKLLAAARGDVHVLACIDSIQYVDGSGVIIN
jgi:hypothetical protein